MPASLEPNRAELIEECIRMVACPICWASSTEPCRYFPTGGCDAVDPTHRARDLAGMKLFHEKYGTRL